MRLRGIIRKSILSIFSVLLLSSGYAQDYGNEWINFNQTYYRIPVAQEGVYRITFFDLLNAGFPVDAVDPRRIQLFHRGVEQAIHIEGQQDAVFNTSDFLEFYGVTNDGTSDVRLYQTPQAQPHQLYNLYTDTTAYFLTFQLGPVNGKRMASFSENNVTGIPAQQSHNEENLQLIVDRYSLGESFGSDFINLTVFDDGEGWLGGIIQENQFLDYTVSGVNNSLPSIANPRLNVLVVGQDNVTHDFEILVGPDASSLRVISSNNIFSDYSSVLIDEEIEWSDISAAGDLVVRIRALGINGGNDIVSGAFVRLIYPQAFDMQGQASKKFYLNQDPSDRSFLEIQNTPINPLIYDVTDLANVLRIGVNDLGGNINAIIPNTSTARTLVVNGPEFIIPTLSRVSFRPITPANHNYIIISHRSLMRPAGGVNDAVKAYSDYRASAAGGNFDTLVVDIQQLYNQFNFGEVSTLAIFDFMRFMWDNGDPEFLFLLGKGLNPSSGFHRNNQPDTLLFLDLVPPAGEPGSDMFYTVGLDGIPNVPAVPTGRLTASSPQQIIDYLNKVIETEATPFEDLWRKRVLHLSGGITPAELIRFNGYTNAFQTVAEDVFLGGEVTTIRKSVNSTVQQINVSDQVNEGVNLVTFFGHSAPAITDIDIGFVTDDLLGYSNQGRYPMFLLNGCNAGEFFNSQIIFGEDWILAPERGAVGFIAHTSFGFESTLRRYSDTFYSVAYGDSVFLSSSIGEIQLEVAKRYLNGVLTGALDVSQVQQMLLLGDPAVQLFGAERADYEINDNSILIEAFDGGEATAALDSFALRTIVRNFGRVNEDSINVRATRTFSDNTQEVFEQRFPNVFFQDTLTITIPNAAGTGAGDNRFDVEIDFDGLVNELDETNNIASINFLIQSNSTFNVFPINYGIVNASQVELLAQATDLLQGERDFQFEIDTAFTFDSPFRQAMTVRGRTIASWQVDLLNNTQANDSAVYYWRTRFAVTQDGESDEWVTSSFTFINNGQEGWIQSQFGQFIENQTIGLDFDTLTRKLQFQENSQDVSIITFGSNNPATTADVSVQIDGIEFIVPNPDDDADRTCNPGTLNLIAFDRSTVTPFQGVFFSRINDRRSCGRSPQVINSFTAGQITGPDMWLNQYVDNLNNGDFVVLFTIDNFLYSSLTASNLSSLEQLGISSADITTLSNGDPIIAVGRKGAAPGTATIVVATDVPANEQQINLDEIINGIFTEATITTPLIGPASSWDRLFTAVDVSELPQTDVFDFDLIGLDDLGNETALLTGLTANETDISSIDAIQYPYLRMRWNIADETNLTAPQLDKWQINYTGVPEGILFFTEDNQQSTLTRQEGELFTTSLSFINVSERSFSDSLRVEFNTFNANTRTAIEGNLNIAAPAPGDTSVFQIDIPTLNNVGLNDFRLFVNPRVLPEQYYDNNIIALPNYLKVEADNTNPVLDVVFDGEHILDGDIVSPNPLIGIKLRDENRFIFNNDTTDINIFLRPPCESCNFERVSFSNPNVTWTPADEENDFRVEFQPQNLADGVYTLRVDASDVSGNSSGTEPFSINFEVINESQITNFYPYPNPFSTSTQFVFTLTGAEIPDEIKIQIMTVSGKIVREITQDELGPIRIGNNITDYAWDGKDEFGDQLANGVYIYRVVVRRDGEELEKRPTSADRAFKKGFGKLYLLR
ncbi:MAG: C25 family cysteine peptidase [Bacteroidota bacterium]